MKQSKEEYGYCNCAECRKFYHNPAASYNYGGHLWALGYLPKDGQHFLNNLPQPTMHIEIDTVRLGWAETEAAHIKDKHNYPWCTEDFPNGR